MLRRRHPAGPVVAGVLLVMLLTLSVAMLAVTPVAWAAGLGTDPVVARQLVIFTVVFGVLGAAEAWLLLRASRTLLPVPAPVAPRRLVDLARAVRFASAGQACSRSACCPVGWANPAHGRRP